MTTAHMAILENIVTLICACVVFLINVNTVKAAVKEKV